MLTADNVNQMNELEDDEEEKDDGEISRKLCEAIQIVQRLRLFSVTQCPQLHQAMNDIEFKLIYLSCFEDFSSEYIS